mgnify:CR=1 FL=1
MISNSLIFYLTSGMLVGFAILALCLKNVIYSLISSIVVFFLTGLVFLLLGSEYNAIIQVAIYGLAVPIIIGVSVMFTNMGKEQSRNEKFTIPYLMLMFGGIFVLAFLYLVMMSLAIVPDTFNLMEYSHATSFDTISAFAKGIFVNYAWAFELTSLLLTIVIAGLVLLAQRKRG